MIPGVQSYFIPALLNVLVLLKIMWPPLPACVVSGEGHSTYIIAPPLPPSGSSKLSCFRISHAVVKWNVLFFKQMMTVLGIALSLRTFPTKSSMELNVKQDVFCTAYQLILIRVTIPFKHHSYALVSPQSGIVCISEILPSNDA